MSRKEGRGQILKPKKNMKKQQIIELPEKAPLALSPDFPPTQPCSPQNIIVEINENNQSIFPLSCYYQFAIINYYNE